MFRFGNYAAKITKVEVPRHHRLGLNSDFFVRAAVDPGHRASTVYPLISDPMYVSCLCASRASVANTAPLITKVVRGHRAAVVLPVEEGAVEEIFFFLHFWTRF